MLNFVSRYSREGLCTGIVHVGVGNFHRAHQAVVVDDLLQQGLGRDFAICGVGLLPGDRRMRDVIRAQDGYYVLELRHPDGRREARVVGSIIDYLFAPDDPEAVIERMAVATTRIVSLTITEGGYNIDPASGIFDGSDPGVAHDLAHPERPRTVFGLVVEALRRRRDRGLPAFTVMSCDNLPRNGVVARKAFLAFAQLRDPDLAEWIARETAFPDSMVDRITPVTTEADRSHAIDDLGVADDWPVACEPFFQWVLEDRFSAGRPPFERAGVQLVDQVAPYELMKLRLLNGAHQAMAYLGALAGYELVEEAMADDDLRAFVVAYMAEAAQTLSPVPGVDVDMYQATLLTRFSNPAIRDTLARLCAESSDRIPKFVVPAIRDNLSSGRSAVFGAVVLASWARYAAGRDDLGRALAIVDRRAGERQGAAKEELDDPGAFLRDESLFGDLRDHEGFVHDYLLVLDRLGRLGARGTASAVVGGAG
jgi:mannitol 2-dehydrogenase